MDSYNQQTQILKEILEELKQIKSDIKEIKTNPGIFPQVKSSGNGLGKNGEPAFIKRLKYQETAEPDTPREDPLIKWFKSRNITVKNYAMQEATDRLFDQLAVFAGERYSSIKDLLSRIKSNLSTGDTFRLNVEGYSPQAISDCTNFCIRLQEATFIHSYDYDRKSRTISACPQRMGKVINFFSGGWFERYTFLKIYKVLNQKGLLDSFLKNVQVTFHDGKEAEMDLLFSTKKSAHPLWIECKTGEYSEHVKKYVEYRKILSLPPENSILIVLDLPDFRIDELGYLHRLTFANQNNFINKVWESFDGAIASNLPSSTKNAAGILKKAGLRPHPEHRKEVIKRFLELLKGTTRPLALMEIKQQISDALDNEEEISRSIVQDILNAIMESGYLMDEDKMVISNWNVPIYYALSLKPEFVEQKCVEAYFNTVNKSDKGFFSRQENRREFEETVGAKITKE